MSECEGKNVSVLVHAFCREREFVCLFVFLLNWVTDFYELLYERYATFIQ
jgi:hypothetical protein